MKKSEIRGQESEVRGPTEEGLEIEMARLDADAQKLRIQIRSLEVEIEKLMHYRQAHYVAILKLRQEKG